MGLRFLGALVVSVGLATPAFSATISFSDMVPLQSTNWMETIAVSQFDSSLGTLNFIDVRLMGAVEGSAEYESRDAAPSTVTLDLAADIMLAGPSGIMASIVPMVTQVDFASAFDGAIDFDGDSGGTFNGLMGMLSDTTTLTGAAMDPFIGTGNVSLMAGAMAMSMGSGPGNALYGFTTNAAAAVTVTYDYTEVSPPTPGVPEPSAALVFGLGFLATAVHTRRR